MSYSALPSKANCTNSASLSLDHDRLSQRFMTNVRHAGLVTFVIDRETATTLSWGTVVGRNEYAEEFELPIFIKNVVERPRRAEYHDEESREEVVSPFIKSLIFLVADCLRSFLDLSGLSVIRLHPPSTPPRFYPISVATRPLRFRMRTAILNSCITLLPFTT